MLELTRTEKRINKLVDTGLYFCPIFEHYTHEDHTDFNYPIIDLQCDTEEQFNRAIEGFEIELKKRA